YQQQGRMISDADMNELMELLKRRIDEALGDVVGSGAPRTAGLPLIDAGPVIRRAPFYVDGIRARLEPDATVAPSATTFALNHQADFPSPPAWPAGDQIIYADVWELATTALQDGSLLDAGLHGADTCTRTQTLAQVKWCATTVDPLTDAKNPSKGNAPLKLEIRQGASTPDPCDPCAAEVALDRRVGNYLFRVEVHDVQGAANAPTEITLKWSSENGAEQHAQADVPSEFKRGDWIYEFYNDTTERHLGVHLVSGFAPARGVLKDGWPAAADLPDKNQYPYVRRWDGYCVLVKSGMTWSVKFVTGAIQGKDKGRPFAALATGATPTHGDYLFSGADFIAHLSGLKLTLTLGANSFVAGDFWLAAVREDADEAARVQPGQSVPVGVTHHYIVLARANGATVQALNDADTRQLSFPRLTNLTADRIGYSTGPSGGAVEQRWQDILEVGGTSGLPVNVQQALDSLVQGIESSDIRYELPGCMGNTVRALLWPAGPTSQKINDLLNTVLCNLDSSKVPYTAGGAGSTVQQVLDQLNHDVGTKVNRAGDTMTGSLAINTGNPAAIQLDAAGVIAAKGFKLDLGATVDKSVLTYDLATGLAKWTQTSLTAWNLSGGNLSTDTVSVTGNITIGAPAGQPIALNGNTTLTGNLQVSGDMRLTGSARFGTTTTPMLYIYEAGTTNAERPVISHSPSFPTYGLSYRDVGDLMIFQASGTPVMTVDLANQRVGVGTVSPAAKLQVVNGAIMPAGGNSSAAGILFPTNPGGGAGDAAWIRYFARTGEATTLQIGISNDADDHLSLMPSGNVGVGTDNPQQKLHVAGAFLRVDGAGNEQAYIGGDGAGNDVQIGSFSPTVTNVALWSAPNGTWMNLHCLNLTQHSDANSKTNVARITGALDKVNQLRGVSFQWKHEHDKEAKAPKHLGVIAQEVAKVVPEAVTKTARGSYGVSYTELVPVLIEAVKELNAKCERLDAELTKLRAGAKRSRSDD
ncbi:MAG: tail fiber domain-containing protein, partial [Sulfurifustaceae bacterium]